jgi:hypothetical protein
VSRIAPAKALMRWPALRTGRTTLVLMRAPLKGLEVDEARKLDATGAVAAGGTAKAARTAARKSRPQRGRKVLPWRQREPPTSRHPSGDLPGRNLRRASHTVKDTRGRCVLVRSRLPI